MTVRDGVGWEPGGEESDRWWKLYLLVLGWLIGLQGVEAGKLDWPMAGISFGPALTNAHEGT